MRPYSLDLRHRVVNAFENQEGTIEEIASLFDVGKTFVNDMLRLKRTTGSVQPRPHAGGASPSLKPKHLQSLKEKVALQPDVTLSELRQQLQKKEHLTVSRATICRALQRLDLPLKKRVSSPAIAMHKNAKPLSKRSRKSK